MPFDNIKTRMQALGAESRYSNSLDCFTKVRSNYLRLPFFCRSDPLYSYRGIYVQIIREEGTSRLWGGTTPRLARLMVRPLSNHFAQTIRVDLMTSATSQLSGGIIFTVYGKVVELAGKI